ncbi:MAG: deoxyribodipyrimidine photo-lyase, partial [Bacteroidota bacterium]
MKKEVTIFWFRRDFRVEDNASLFHALKSEYPVQPLFIFDAAILDKLEDKADARVAFIHQEISRLSKELRARNTTLDVRYGNPIDVWKQLLEDYNVRLVYANRDYEPYARERDKMIYDLLNDQGISFKAKKDHVIFEKDEVLKKDGKPYTVFTPYSRVWKDLLSSFYLKSYPSETINNWNQTTHKDLPSLDEIGFHPSKIPFPSKELNEGIVDHYHETRDIPSKRGTTRLSLHLRFGTISIRQLATKAHQLNDKYLNELIWRDFYQSILWQFPD